MLLFSSSITLQKTKSLDVYIIECNNIIHNIIILYITILPCSGKNRLLEEPDCRVLPATPLFIYMMSHAHHESWLRKCRLFPNSQVQREDNSKICVDKTLTLLLSISWFQFSATFHKQNQIFITVNISQISNTVMIVCSAEKDCSKLP